MIITPKRKVTDLLPSEAILISNDFERDVILQLMEDAGMDWADGEKATNWNPIQVGYKYPFVLFNHPHDIGCIAFRAFGDQINILPILNATDFIQTRNKMSAHTPTPWMVSDRFPYNVADDKIVVANCNTQANAARIVQCVNACEGLSNEDLSDMSRYFGKEGRTYYTLVKDMRTAQAEAESLRAERDGLLEALSEIKVWAMMPDSVFDLVEQTLAKYETK